MRIVLVSILWSFISSLSSSAMAMALRSSMGITGGARNGIGNAAGKSASFLRASDIDRNSNAARNESTISNRMKKRKKTAVIVGGGPGGLAAALVLSNVKKQGEETGFFERIIVLDEAPKESYDPTRAYFFNINRRGQTFADAFNIDLSKRGTAIAEFSRQSVPSDPKDVFDGTNPFSRSMSDEERQRLGTSYWIPRHELVELITDEILAKNKEKNDGSAIIEFRRGVRCEYIEPTEDGLVKIVANYQHVTKNKNDDFIVADFCVGADGGVDSTSVFGRRPL